MKTRGSRGSQAACSWSEQVWGSQVAGSHCLVSWSPSFPDGPTGEAAAFVCWLLFAVCGLDLLNHPWSLLRNAGRAFFRLSVLALGHPASPPSPHFLPWLRLVPLILLMSPGQPLHPGESLLLGLPACHVFLFIYPLPCLFRSGLPRTAGPPACRPSSSALSVHVVALRGMTPQPQRHLQT